MARARKAIKRFNLEIPESLHERIEKLAAEAGRSVTEEYRHMARLWLVARAAEKVTVDGREVVL